MNKFTSYLEYFGVIKLIVKPVKNDCDNWESKYILWFKTPPKGWRWF
jgi:hypothetical protein